MQNIVLSSWDLTNSHRVGFEHQASVEDPCVWKPLNHFEKSGKIKDQGSGVAGLQFTGGSRLLDFVLVGWQQHTNLQRAERYRKYLGGASQSHDTSTAFPFLASIATSTSYTAVIPKFPDKERELKILSNPWPARTCPQMSQLAGQGSAVQNALTLGGWCWGLGCYAGSWRNSGPQRRAQNQGPGLGGISAMCFV